MCARLSECAGEPNGCSHRVGGCHSVSFHGAICNVLRWVRAGQAADADDRNGSFCPDATCSTNLSKGLCPFSRCRVPTIPAAKMLPINDWPLLRRVLLARHLVDSNGAHSSIIPPMVAHLSFSSDLDYSMGKQSSI